MTTATKTRAIGGLVARAAMATAAIGLGVFAISPATAADRNVAVMDANNTFSPASITVQAGDRVIWTWPTPTINRHSVTADNGSFDSHPTCGSNPNQCGKAGETFSYTFNTAGTFRYYCVIHGQPGGSGMSGAVTVNAPPTPSPSTPSPSPSASAGPSTTPAPSASPSPSPESPSPEPSPSEEAPSPTGPPEAYQSFPAESDPSPEPPPPAQEPAPAPPDSGPRVPNRADQDQAPGASDPIGQPGAPGEFVPPVVALPLPDIPQVPVAPAPAPLPGAELPPAASQPPAGQPSGTTTTTVGPPSLRAVLSRKAVTQLGFLGALLGGIAGFVLVTNRGRRGTRPA